MGEGRSAAEGTSLYTGLGAGNNAGKQPAAAWQHLQQHPTEVNVYDAVEDKVEREVDDLKHICKRSDSQEDFCLCGAFAYVIMDQIHDFTGKDQNEKGHHDDDESQCDSVTGAGHSLLNSVLLSHSVGPPQGSDQGTIAEAQDCHGNQDSQDCFGPDERLSNGAGLIYDANIN